jgi:omega-3 fatty acid desaturase (delta-15 desaturase)
MWCIFVIGHDCGHTNFSNHKRLNDIIGHITHGSILVPFYPWALSHRRHHMFHNHIDKDYSYHWFPPGKEELPTTKFFHKHFLAKLLLPFYGEAHLS